MDGYYRELYRQRVELEQYYYSIPLSQLREQLEDNPIALMVYNQRREAFVRHVASIFRPEFSVDIQLKFMEQFPDKHIMFLCGYYECRIRLVPSSGRLRDAEFDFCSRDPLDGVSELFDHLPSDWVDVHLNQ